MDGKLQSSFTSRTGADKPTVQMIYIYLMNSITLCKNRIDLIPELFCGEWTSAFYWVFSPLGSPGRGERLSRSSSRGKTTRSQQRWWLAPSWSFGRNWNRVRNQDQSESLIHTLWSSTIELAAKPKWIVPMQWKTIVASLLERREQEFVVNQLNNNRIPQKLRAYSWRGKIFSSVHKFAHIQHPDDYQRRHPG